MRRTSRGVDLVAVGGLALAALAELCATGLTGVSGWFVTSCAVAGAAVFSAFSYIAPSGAVRAVALARIGTNYGQRLVLHASALRRVAHARASFFRAVGAVEEERVEQIWSADLLERTLADADAVGMGVIRSTAPFVVSIVTSVAGAAVIAWSGAPLVAAVTIVGVAMATAVARIAARFVPASDQEARSAVRKQVITAVTAWPEMVSLGAADQLAQQALRSVDVLHGARSDLERNHRRAAALTELILVGTGVLALVLAISSGLALETLVFTALITLGVLGTARPLRAAVDAGKARASAAGRLALEDHEVTGAHPVPDVDVDVSGDVIAFANYPIPDLPLRPARVLNGQLIRGEILVVTGRSGRGKSTLLRTLERQVRRRSAARGASLRVTRVDADDYLFTGTIGSNFRLADPTLNDREIGVLLSEVGMSERRLSASTPVGEGGRSLSGGERRRLFLSRALARRPDMLFVDEPTTSLDPDSEAIILDLLERQSDVAVILAMHGLPSVWSHNPKIRQLNLD